MQEHQNRRSPAACVRRYVLWSVLFGILFLLGQEPPVCGNHKITSISAGFYKFIALYWKRNRLFSYIITPSDKKSKPETKNVSLLDVFPKLIRSDFESATYSFTPVT